MRLSLVVAVAENGVIGRRGALPWRLPDDLKRFKELTLGHPVIMGRKTFASLGRPLPGRTNVVVTRDPARVETSAGVVVAASFDDALAAVADAGEAFVIGGAALFDLALPLASRAYVTEVHAPFDGDVVWTAFLHGAPPGWNEAARVRHDADARHSVAFSFVDFARTR